MQKIEQAALLVLMALVAVLFISGLANNPALLDWSLPIGAAIIAALWLYGGHRPHQQH
jgi:hypothetical protein